MQPVVYSRRRNAISRVEREWRVEDNGLAMRGLVGGEKKLPWCEIMSVRLCSAPKPHRPWRHVFEITPKQGRKIVIDNAHFVSRSHFEDRSNSYTSFVRAVADRLAHANPKARALLGETPTHYFLTLLGGLVGLGLLAFALIAVQTPFDNLPGVQLAKLGIVLAMLPLFAWWLVKAVPRGVAMDDIPTRAFPVEHHSHHAHESVTTDA